jgi:hypothetical protein
MVPDGGGWIVAIDVLDETSKLRVSIREIGKLVSVLERARIDATERCGWCNGSGRVDIGDPDTFCDEHYVDCKYCNGSGRLQKNVVPRAKCMHESFVVPGKKHATYCMAHCTNPGSPMNGKTCEDHVRRDCKR